MVTQTRVRHDDRRDYTKHMIRLRHASQINGREANEIILLNSHDGTSSYQMLAGMFRFVCSNGLVCGDTVANVRVPHKGDVAGTSSKALTKSCTASTGRRNPAMPCAPSRSTPGNRKCSPALRWH